MPRTAFALSRRPEFCWGLLVLAAGLAGWLSRLTGPLDLRYDAGVYYLTGTALAQGKGYRLLNEPGEIEANQYPPLLPAFVAAHQWVLGTADPVTVARWLRVSYCLMFQLALLGIYLFAVRTVPPSSACAIALLSMLSLKAYFLSDLLFAETPVLLVTTAFLLFHQRVQGARGFAGMALCGVAAFLLRTAGVALLAAWVGESLLRRQAGQFVLRLSIALVPVIAWQVYVKRVEASVAYREPAYAYQRALYQFYNVSYAENILKLKDPFIPELGPAGTFDLALRVGKNLPRLVTSLGEVLTGGSGFWLGMTNLPPGSADRQVVLVLAHLLSGLVGVLMLAGILRWALRGAWLLFLYLTASLALVSLTPWPEQFTRYLIPLQPFLLLALIELLGAVRASASSAAGKPERGSGVAPHATETGGQASVGEPPAEWTALGKWALGRFGSAALAAGLLLTAHDLIRALQNRQDEGAVYAGPNQTSPGQLFYYGREWREFDMAVHWLREHAASDAVVATSSPQWVYLNTGLKSVMPPYEKDRTRAHQLLRDVPVTYVLIDDLGFLDVMRRYALPAVRARPDQWKLVHTVPRSQSKYRGRTAIYMRIP